MPAHDRKPFRRMGKENEVPILPLDGPLHARDARASCFSCRCWTNSRGILPLRLCFRERFYQWMGERQHGMRESRMPSLSCNELTRLFFITFWSFIRVIGSSHKEITIQLRCLRSHHILRRLLSNRQNRAYLKIFPFVLWLANTAGMTR